MKIVSNEPLIRRNKRLGQYAMFGGLAVLAVGLVLSFQNNSSLLVYSYVSLLIGVVLSQVGIYFSNRWGRSPRPDALIAQGLKGLDDRYTLLNFSSPVSYLLLGPAGVWILIPYHQKGKITYENGRWRQKGGNFYMKIFAQEGIGRPDLEVTHQVNELTKGLSSALTEDQRPPINTALVFMNDKAEIEADQAPCPTLKLSKLKEFIRKKAKENAFPPEVVQTLQDAFERS
jgi:hypothetical protein